MINTSLNTYYEETLEAERKTRGVKTNLFKKIARLAKLWVPLAKRLLLSGVRLANGTVVKGHSDIFTQLANDWCPTFERKPFDEQAAKLFLDQYGTQHTFSNTQVPDVEYIELYLSKLVDSGVGPDGLPYSAWRAAGRQGARVLFRYLCFLMNGGLPLASFNASLLIFIPKGEDPADAVEVIRASQDNRPLTLKNTDNKILCGSMVSTFREHAVKHTNKIQRGFVSGRNFINNVVDLDSAARIFPCILYIWVSP